MNGEPGPRGSIASELWRIVRFGIVGGAASGTYAVVVIGLVDGLRFDPTAASVIGYLCGIPVSFFGQKYFTFGSKARAREEIGRFIIVQLINLVLSLVVMRFVTVWLGLSHWLGIVAVIGVIALMTYGALRTHVFHGAGKGLSS